MSPKKEDDEGGKVVRWWDRWEKDTGVKVPQEIRKPGNSTGRSSKSLKKACAGRQIRK